MTKYLLNYFTEGFPPTSICSSKEKCEGNADFFYEH